MATEQTLGECAVNHLTLGVGTSQAFLCVLVPTDQINFALIYEVTD